MTVISKIYPVTFQYVTMFPFGQWLDNWLTEADPGDLLLGPEGAFGLLCVGETGIFMLLTKKQIYEQDPLPWFDHTEPDRVIRLIGNKLNIS